MPAESALTTRLSPTRATGVVVRPGKEPDFSFSLADGRPVARLNLAAAFIWQQCSGSRTLEQIATDIAESVGCDLDQAFEHVSNTVKQLFYHELLHLGPGRSHPIVCISLQPAHESPRAQAVVHALAESFGVVVVDDPADAGLLLHHHTPRAAPWDRVAVRLEMPGEGDADTALCFAEGDFEPSEDAAGTPRLRVEASTRLQDWLRDEDTEPTPVANAPTPRLTIGMATYNDYDGVYFTVQAIRMFHPEVLSEIAFLVIDNNPDGPCADALRSLQSWVPGYRYLARGSITGTAIRDHVFREADTEFVVCVDSHVLVEPGALRKLLDYFDQHPDTPDLLQGPLVFDDLAHVATHFEPVWRGGMFGTWATDPRGQHPDAQPFEIPMQGLGLAACRRAAWLGYNPSFRGFGGEEGYIHEKFRQAGARTLCLPFLRWLHRFARPMGVQYPNRWEDRIRNYLVGFRELGLPTEGIIDHFDLLIGPDAVAGVVQALDREATTSSDLCGDVDPDEADGTSTSAVASLDRGADQRRCPPAILRRYQEHCQTPSDIHEHLPVLRQYASKVRHVVELGVRDAVSTWGLLAGLPASMTSIDIRTSARVGEVIEVARGEGIDYRFQEADSLVVEIPECDLLFIDTLHTRYQLFQELKRHSTRVSRYILLHDTVSYGQQDEVVYAHASAESRARSGAPDERQGLVTALCDFFVSVADGANWRIVQQFPNNNGLSVLARC